MSAGTIDVLSVSVHPKGLWRGHMSACRCDVNARQHLETVLVAGESDKHLGFLPKEEIRGEHPAHISAAGPGDLL